MVSPSQSFEWNLRLDIIQGSEWWHNLRHRSFEDDEATELLMVTDILTTSRWACDYRPPQNERDGHYAANCGADRMLAPGFECHHNGASENVFCSQNYEEHTVLAKYVVVKRRGIGPVGRWVQALKT
jgi:hypothetical protein